MAKEPPCNQDCPSVDIIIPVYNTPEQDLMKCLDSLLSQTFYNWRAIIVDDGSNEITQDLLLKVASDERMTVLHQSNTGPSEARNTGIKNITASYYTFVDADDELDPLFLENAISIAVAQDLDLVIGKTATCTVIEDSFSSYCQIFEGQEVSNLLDSMLGMYPYPDRKPGFDVWLGRVYGKLYRSSRYQHILFPLNMHLHEDNIYSLDILLQSNRIGIIDSFFYYYRNHNYSITHSHMPATKSTAELLFLRELQKRQADISNRDSLRGLWMRYVRLTWDYLSDLASMDISNSEVSRAISNFSADYPFSPTFTYRSIHQFNMPLCLRPLAICLCSTPSHKPYQIFWIVFYFRRVLKPKRYRKR